MSHLSPVPDAPSFCPTHPTVASLLQHLPDLQRIVRSLGRRYRLAEADEGDLLGEVVVRLLAEEGAVLRKYRGTSAIAAYLYTVAYRVLLDTRVKAWGKWRPSSRARKLGAPAVYFERLVGRDGLTPGEARAVLEHHPTLRLTPMAAETLETALPRRARRRMIPLDSAADLAAASSEEDWLNERRASSSVERVCVGLRRALQALNAEERTLLRQRFVEGRSVAEIARHSGANQKALYRRFESLLKRLRAECDAAQIEREDVRALVGHARVTIGAVLA